MALVGLFIFIFFSSSSLDMGRKYTSSLCSTKGKKVFGNTKKRRSEKIKRWWRRGESPMSGWLAAGSAATYTCPLTMRATKKSINVFQPAATTLCVATNKQNNKIKSKGKDKIRIDDLNPCEKSQWNLFPLFFRRINLHVWWIGRQVMGEGNVTVCLSEREEKSWSSHDRIHQHNNNNPTKKKSVKWIERATSPQSHIPHVSSPSYRI